MIDHRALLRDPEPIIQQLQRRGVGSQTVAELRRKLCLESGHRIRTWLEQGLQVISSQCRFEAWNHGVPRRDWCRGSVQRD